LKYDQFEEIDVHADNGIKSLISINNIAKYGSKHYFVAMDGTTAHIYSSSDFESAAVSEDSRNAIGFTFISGVCRVYDDRIMGLVIGVDSTPTYLAIYFISEDGGNTWSNGLSAGGADILWACDMWYQEGEYWVLIQTLFSATSRYRLYAQIHDTAGEKTVNTGGDTLYELFYGGYFDYVNSRYVVLMNEGSDVFKTYYLDFAGGFPYWHLIDTITDFIEPANYDFKTQFYYEDSFKKLCMMKDYLYYYTNGKWSSLSSTNVDVIGIIWDMNSDGEYFFNWFFWNDQLWKIFKNGGIMSIQKLDEINAYCGHGDFFSTGSAIYQKEFADLLASKCLITNEFLLPPKVEIISTIKPMINQGLFIYDENDVLRAITYIKDYTQQKDKQYIYECESPFKYDLEAKVPYTPDAKDAPDILKHVIDTYCRFFHYGAATINTTPADTYSFPFNRSVKKVFEWASKQEGYFLSVRADGEVYYDEMTASGETLTFDTDAMEEPKVTPRNLKLSYIYIEGGFVNGVRLTSEAYGEPNFGTYKDKFPEIDNQTDLDSMRDSILTQRNQSVTQYTSITHAVKYFDYGTTVVLTDANYSISADTYYINGVVWNLLPENKMCILKMTSALYLPSLNERKPSNPALSNAINNLREDTANQIDNVNQDVDNIEKNLHWTWRDPNAFDFRIVDLTNTASTWNDLDLSAIVGSAEMLVMLGMVISDDAAGSAVRFRPKGNSNSIARLAAYTQVSGVNFEFSGIVKTDSSGVIQIYSNPKPTDMVLINIVVRGYKDA